MSKSRIDQIPTAAEPRATQKPKWERLRDALLPRYSAADWQHDWLKRLGVYKAPNQHLLTNLYDMAREKVSAPMRSERVIATCPGRPGCGRDHDEGVQACYVRLTTRRYRLTSACCTAAWRACYDRSGRAAGRPTSTDSLVGPSPRAAAKGGRKARDDSSLVVDLRTGFWHDRLACKSGLGARSVVSHIMDVPLDEAVAVLLHELHRAPGGAALRPLTAGRAQSNDLNKALHGGLSPYVRKELLYEAAKRHAPHHR